MPDYIRVDDGGGREKAKAVNYPSNAIRAKEDKQPPEEKKVEAVVTGAVVRRKRSPFARLTQGFVAEDSGSVVEYLLGEVLLPAAKSLIYDMLSEGLHRKLYGDSKPKSSVQRGYTNYSSRSSTSTGMGSRHIPGSTSTPSNVTPLTRRQRATHEFNDIMLASRADAEDVLDRMRDLISQYGVATVSDFFDLVGQTSDFTDNKWGWFDLRSARIDPVRGGYVFHLPRPEVVG